MNTLKIDYRWGSCLLDYFGGVVLGSEKADHQFNCFKWGDKSFTGEPIGDFMGQNAMSNEDESNCGGKALSNRDI